MFLRIGPSKVVARAIIIVAKMAFMRKDFTRTYSYYLLWLVFRVPLIKPLHNSRNAESLKTMQQLFNLVSRPVIVEVASCERS